MSCEEGEVNGVNKRAPGGPARRVSRTRQRVLRGGHLSLATQGRCAMCSSCGGGNGNPNIFHPDRNPIPNEKKPQAEAGKHLVTVCS